MQSPVRERSSPPAEPGLPLREAAALDAATVLDRLGSGSQGISLGEAAGRLGRLGPNVIGDRSTGPWTILLRQLRNPLLILLAAAALTSIYFGQHTDAAIVLAILLLSVGLGFFNEYRSERALAELHARIRHRTVVVRAGHVDSVDVVDLVPGDVVLLDVGDIVPADLRLLRAEGLECDEAVISGESLPVVKTAEAATGVGLELASCALMGTVIRAGRGSGVVVATGGATVFGRIAHELGRAAVETGFQAGLRGFSMLLVRVAAVLSGSIFVLNWLLGRSLLESALFSLAIAVGLTPQLLPAITTVSMSAGARSLARRSVLVKRLVSIEDLGNIQVLFTDKTGTLTEGAIAFSSANRLDGSVSRRVLELGLVCSAAAVDGARVVGGNPLDRALWAAPGVAPDSVQHWNRVAELPFDYTRRTMSVLADGPQGRLLVTKGAPESVLAHCRPVPGGARREIDRRFAAGARLVAVATRAAPDLRALTAADERDLELQGFLSFLDPPKADAAASLERLRRLAIEVKIVTGDNAAVATRVCSDLGIEVGRVLTGEDVAGMDDAELARALPATTVFARVAPDQKSRIVTAQRRFGSDVAFLGDGVNDAVALHDADVGISVDTAADVARDAADIVLLEKDLGVVADGVVEGRRIFANTIKYVLMGTSSNFGNMFSAAAASLFLPFLPMTPSQVLLNNLLYDLSEMTIPTDNVDADALNRPARWDVAMIRRYMLVFGPISSIFDFATYGLMLLVFHAGASLFQSGWFVESLATQALVIFVIRTHRVPFFRSTPSRALLAATVAVGVTGAALPYSPFGPALGFTPLPAGYFLALAAMIVIYLVLVEAAKLLVLTPRARPAPQARRPVAVRVPAHRHALKRRSARWSEHPRRTPRRRTA